MKSHSPTSSIREHFALIEEMQSNLWMAPVLSKQPPVFSKHQRSHSVLAEITVVVLPTTVISSFNGNSTGMVH